MADFVGELLRFLIEAFFEFLFAPCHTQRGCVSSLVTGLSLVATVGCLIAAAVIEHGPVALLLGGLGALSGVLFIAAAVFTIWSKCVDEPKQ